MTLLVCTTQDLSTSKILYDITRMYYTRTIYIQDSVWHYLCVLHKNYLHPRFCMALLVYTTQDLSTSKILHDITCVYYTRTIYIQDSVWHYSCVLHENYLHPRFCMALLVYTTQDLSTSKILYDITHVYYTRTIYIQDSVWHYSCVLHKNYLHPRFCMTLIVCTTQELSTSKILHDITRVYYTRTIYIQDSVWHYSCVLHKNYLHPRFCMTLLVCTTQELSTSKILYDITRVYYTRTIYIQDSVWHYSCVLHKNYLHPRFCMTLLVCTTQELSISKILHDITRVYYTGTIYIQDSVWHYSCVLHKNYLYPRFCMTLLVCTTRELSTSKILYDITRVYYTRTIYIQDSVWHYLCVLHENYLHPRFCMTLLVYTTQELSTSKILYDITRVYYTRTIYIQDSVWHYSCVLHTNYLHPRFCMTLLVCTTRELSTSKILYDITRVYYTRTIYIHDSAWHYSCVLHENSLYPRFCMTLLVCTTQELSTSKILYDITRVYYTRTIYIQDSAWHYSCVLHKNYLHPRFCMTLLVCTTRELSTSNILYDITRVYYTRTIYIQDSVWHSSCVLHENYLHPRFCMTLLVYTTQELSTSKILYDITRVYYTRTIYIQDSAWHYSCILHKNYLHPRFCMTLLVYTTRELSTSKILHDISRVYYTRTICIQDSVWHYSCVLHENYLHPRFCMALLVYTTQDLSTSKILHDITRVYYTRTIYIQDSVWHYWCVLRKNYLHPRFCMTLIVCTTRELSTSKILHDITRVYYTRTIYIQDSVWHYSCILHKNYLHPRFCMTLLMYTTQELSTSKILYDITRVYYTRTIYIQDSAWHYSCILHKIYLHLRFCMTLLVCTTQELSTSKILYDITRVYYTRTIYIQDSAWHYSCVLHENYLHPRFCMTLLVCTSQELSTSKILYDITRVYYTRSIYIQDSVWHYSCVLHKNYLHPRFCMTLLVCTTQELSTSKILHGITRVYYTRSIYIQDSAWHYLCVLHKNYLHPRFCMTLLVCTTRELSTSKILYGITRVYYTRTIFIQDSVWHYSCVLHENYLHPIFCMTLLVYTTQELSTSKILYDITRVYYTRTIYIQDSAWHYSCILHKNYLHPRFCMTLLVCTTRELSTSNILYDITRVYYTRTIYIQDSVWHSSCVLHDNYLHPRFCMTLLVYTTRELSTSKILYDITRVYYTRTIYIQDSARHYSFILHKNYLYPRFCMTLLVCTTQELSTSKILYDITRVYYTRTIYIQDSVWHYSCVLHENNLYPRFCMTLLVYTTQELSASKILHDITRVYYTRTIYIQDSAWHYSCVLHKNYLHPRFCMTLLVCTTQELSTSKILYDITRVYYTGTIYIQDSVWHYSCILHKNYLHPRFCMTLPVYTTQELSTSKILYDITRVYYTRTIYIQDSAWHFSCILHKNYLHPRFCMTLLVYTTQELSTSKICMTLLVCTTPELSTSKILHGITRVYYTRSIYIQDSAWHYSCVLHENYLHPRFCMTLLVCTTQELSASKILYDITRVYYTRSIYIQDSAWHYSCVLHKNYLHPRFCMTLIVCTTQELSTSKILHDITRVYYTRTIYIQDSV